MDHFRHIYTTQAAAYHRLIAAEDVDQNLTKTLKALATFGGKRVLDLGTGTGRLPLLFAHEAQTWVGVDLHWDMVRENATQRQAQPGQWSLAQADMRALPLPARWAEVVTAGWALGHFVGWYGADWQTEATRVLQEMTRVAAPGGTILILETLGTGSLTPAPPHAGLAQYYAWLETTWGFTRHTVATDYQFTDVAEAVQVTEFFFGAELAAKIRANGWARVPEWTGVWVKVLRS